jgi:hypothetical protein
MFERALRLLAIATLFSAAPGLSYAAPPQLARVPAAFRGDQVYLQVRLNGGAPVWMAFDFNAPASTLCAGARPVTRATVRAGTIAQVVTFRRSVCAAGVAGRLGTDWLGDRVAEIRTREHEVWVSAPVTPPPAARAFVAASLTP